MNQIKVGLALNVKNQNYKEKNKSYQNYWILKIKITLISQHSLRLTPIMKLNQKNWKINIKKFYNNQKQKKNNRNYSKII